MFDRALVLAALSLMASPLCGGERRFLLTSSSTNVEIADFSLNTAEAGHWKIRKETLHGGKQEGVSLVHLDNGRMTVSVIPTRGMSILSVRDSQTGERIFGWDSPVKEVVHPNQIDLESRGGLGWLEGFNEWMVRCGLEFAGHPGLDQFTTNTGDVSEMNLSLHGKIGNIPASEVELVIEETAPYRVTLRGTVHERLFFGPKLQLSTELSLLPNSTDIHLHDEMTNNGSAPQEFQLIYHTNFGAPILEEGSQVVVAAKELAPMNSTAAASIDSYDDYAGPTPGFLEQVYLVSPLADEQGRTTAVLSNKAGDRGAVVSWNVSELPYLTIWKNTVAEADGYVTGIEPATGFPFNRKVERHYGRVPKLAPGETRSFDVTFSLLDTSKAVASAVEEVHNLQKQVETIVHTEPPATTWDE